MRTKHVVPALIVIATATAVLAQQPRPAARRRPAASADAGASTDAASADGGTSATPAASTSTTTTTAAHADGGAAASASSDGGAATANTTSFNLPMNQRGTGAINHYPIPEQLARTAVPVFVQVSSTAPIDHVSMFYRGTGGARFREVRMTAMGQEFGLPGGYGAQIPCEDSFPPAVEYYVQSIDTSGAPVGSAGSANAPIRLPIVLQRSHAIVPTLPGQAAPRSCGAITVPTVARPGTTTGPGVTNPAARGDAGAAEPVAGTADLGEPCTHNSDCHRGLRCGSNHQCVFISGHH